MDFLAELRRRSVFRVAAAYLISGWVVMQVVSLIATTAGMPSWASPLVLMFIIAGFPISLIVAWAFELTPEGPKRTEDRGEGESIKPFRPADAILVAGLAIVIGAIIWQQVSNPTQVQNPADERITGQSIAVLPFVAISDAPEDVILGDGLAEELLNVLAQFPDLAVAGRTSSFAFRDQAEDLRAIGDGLGVNHVLEGSVRRSQDQLRITAQLIRVADGFHVWSGNYNRPFTDILEIQDDIVHQLAQVLAVRLGIGATARDNVQTANPAAYEQYLRGRYLFAERENLDNRQASLIAFQTAVDIDPDFAAAWAGLARAIVYTPWREAGATDPTTHWERGRRAAERALVLDPNNAEALVSLAYWHSFNSKDWAAVEEHLNRALELAPNAAFAHYTNAIVTYVFGDTDHLTSSLRRAMALDPLNQTIRRNAAERLYWAGFTSEARRIFETTRADHRARANAELNFALIDGDADAAEQAARDFRQAVMGEPNLQALFGVSAELNELVAPAMRGEGQTIDAMRPQLVAWMEQGLLQASDIALYDMLLGDYERAAEGLLQDAEQSTNWFLAVLVGFPFSGIEGLYCQPDYHAIWELPEMAELAAIRLANGATVGLPRAGPECDEWLSNSD